MSKSKALPVAQIPRDQADSWVQSETSGCTFNDQRLGKRFRTLLEQITDGIGQSIPFACQDWANTKAAYRFFSNPKVSEADILSGHFGSTRDRVRCTPPRQNSCRSDRSTPGAAMKDGLGSIRTDIQRQSGGAVAAAGERGARPTRCGNSPSARLVPRTKSGPAGGRPETHRQRCRARRPIQRSGSRVVRCWETGSVSRCRALERMKRYCEWAPSGPMGARFEDCFLGARLCARGAD